MADLADGSLGDEIAAERDQRETSDLLGVLTEPIADHLAEREA